MKKIFISLILLMFAIVLSAQNSSYTETISFADSNITGTDSIYQFSRAGRADCFQKFVKVTLIVNNINNIDATFSFGGGDEDVGRDYNVMHYEYVDDAFFPYTVDTANISGSDPMAMDIGTDTVYTKTWTFYQFPFHRAKCKWTKGSTTSASVRVKLEIGQSDK